MRPRWLVLLLTWPLLELILLLQLADRMGWRIVVMWLFTAGVLGVWLIRRTGWRALMGLREPGQMEGSGMARALELAMQFVAGGLLIVPGVTTDAAALLMLIPPFRRRLAKRIMERVKGDFTIVHASGAATFVDVEAVNVESGPARTPGTRAPRVFLESE